MPWQVVGGQISPVVIEPWLAFEIPCIFILYVKTNFHKTFGGLIGHDDPFGQFRIWRRCGQGICECLSGLFEGDAGFPKWLVMINLECLNRNGNRVVISGDFSIPVDYWNVIATPS
jgi:hypothetical protein